MSNIKYVAGNLAKKTPHGSPLEGGGQQINTYDKCIAHSLGSLGSSKPMLQKYDFACREQDNPSRISLCGSYSYVYPTSCPEINWHSILIVATVPHNPLEYDATNWDACNPIPWLQMCTPGDLSRSGNRRPAVKFYQTYLVFQHTQRYPACKRMQPMQPWNQHVTYVPYAFP